MLNRDKIEVSSVTFVLTQNFECDCGFTNKLYLRLKNQHFDKFKHTCIFFRT